MSSRQTRAPGPILRVFAGATLLVWISALGLCARICSGADGSAADSTHHCHAAADADAHHSGAPGHHHDESPASNHHGPCASTSCLTLQTSLLGSKLVVWHPDLQPVYTLSVFTAELHESAAVSELALRQRKPAEWVFTPEVCLGPAFRSLAPPVV